MKVSVCLIVKNEESNIRRALTSIPSSYEIIVVDTGSTDSTMEIALTFGAKVSPFTWNDNFSEARNESIRKASGDYILIMDADEELTENAEEKIVAFCSQYSSEAGSVIIYNHMDNEISKHRMVRFFPNEKRYTFQGIVHEKLYEDKHPASFKNTEILVNHYGYQEEEYLRKNKFKRYIHLYEKQIEASPNDGYVLYQLGKLYFSMKDYESARSILTACFQIKENDYLYFPVMLVMLGYTLKHLNQSKLAEELLTPYIENYPDFPDLPFLLGLLSMDTGSLFHIELYFLQSLQIGETTKYTSVEGVGTYRAAYNLGVFYEIKGEKQKAIQYYQKSASYQYQPALDRLKLFNKNN